MDAGRLHESPHPAPPRARSAAGGGAAPGAALRRLQSTLGNRRMRQLARDLSAYDKERSEWSSDPEGMSSSVTTESAEGPGLRAALSALISAGKVSEVKSTGGKVWFAANHHRNAQLDDIRKAFADAGYGDADRLAAALYDIHGEFLYTDTKMTSYMLFWENTWSRGKRLATLRERRMTEYEIRQAKRVFKDALDYSKVWIKDGSLSAKTMSVGGYARTIGNTINFPDGGSRDMAFMIHELTHCWQYQKTGWTYAPKALWAQIAEGYSYTENGKSADDSLTDARAAGKTLYDYNKEQQGDILSDYFKRLQRGAATAAYQPFVDDVR
jgi:hypothetical protein